MKNTSTTSWLKNLNSATLVKLSLTLCSVFLISTLGHCQQNPANATPKYEIPTLSYPSSDAFVISYNVMEYGADNTGTTDNADIIQTLLDKMGPSSNGSGQNNGGILFFPAGKYLVNKSIRLPKGVTIRGEWKQPTKGAAIEGTIIMTMLGRGLDSELNKDYELYSLIRMEPSSCVKDLAFWYPEQNAGNIVAYPPTILYGRRGHWGNDYCTVQNVTLINSYDGIVFTQDGIGGAPNAYNIYGTPLRKGIEIDNIAEVGRIEGADFSPEYWAGSGLAGAPNGNTSFKEWLRNNASGVVMRRNDWTYCSRLKVEGYKIGFHAIKTRYQPGLNDKPNGQNYDFSLVDCTYGIYASDPQYTGVMFHKINIKDCDYGVYFPATAENTFQITGASINAKKYAIRSEKGSATRMLFDQCTIASGEIEVLGGSLMLTDSDINNKTPQVKIGLDARAIIVGNRSDKEFDIQNNSMFKCRIDHTPLNNPRIPSFPYQDPWTIKQKPNRMELYLATSSEFGAQPNTNTDNTQAIQNALNKAAADGGGIVYLPPGKYRINTSLTIPTGVELKGAMDVSSLPTGPGSILEAYGSKDNENGDPLVIMSPGSGIRGISINYPEQIFSDLLKRDNGGGGLTPYKYPYSIRANKECYIVNMSFRTAYKGIDMFTNKCDKAYVEYMGGHFFLNGIRVGGKTENAIIRNTQCNTIAYAFGHESKWGNWSNSSSSESDRNPAYDQNSRELEFFTLGDCKNLLMFNNFYFGCQKGCVFANDGDGPSGIALGHGIDAAVKALYFEKVGSDGFDLIGSQMVVLPCPITGGGGQQATRYIETTADFTGKVTLYSGDFWGQPYYSVEMQRGTINLHNCCFSSSGRSRFAEINTDLSNQLNVFGSYIQNSASPINSNAESHFSVRSSILTEGNLKTNECIVYENNLLNNWEFDFVNAINRTGWIATASHANYKANNALDGNPSSRWDTEAVLKGGEWFMVDMREPQQFNKVLLDQGSSSGDYPVGYEIYISDDGTNWGDPITAGNGSGAVTSIDFPNTVTTRYLRVVQKGQTGRYWSIHEFYILNDGSGSSILNPDNSKLIVYYANGQLQTPELSGISQISIYSVSGQLVKTGVSKGSSFPVELNTGIYILRLQNQGKEYHQKLFISK